MLVIANIWGGLNKKIWGGLTIATNVKNLGGLMVAYALVMFISATIPSIMYVLFDS